MSSIFHNQYLADSDLTVRWVESAAQIQPNEWNRLAMTKTFYLSHAWVQSIERMIGLEPRYLAVEQAGRLAAVMPVYAGEVPANPRYRPGSVLAGLDCGWDGRFVLAGAAAGYHTDLLLDDSLQPAARRTVVTILAAELRSVVERERATGAFLLYATTAAADELAAVAPDLLRLRLAPEAEIMLEGTSPEAYLASLSGDRRRRIRHEMRAFAAQRYVCSAEPLTDVWREAAELAFNVERKYGGRLDRDVVERALRVQAEAFGRVGVTFTARSGGALIGMCLAYRWGDALYDRLVGFDYGRLRGAFEYFNLTYYRPIEHCYEHGLRRLHLGLGAYRAKMLRGAVLRPLWALVLGASRTPNAASVRRWDEEQERV